MSVRQRNRQKSDVPKKDLSALLKLEFYRKKDKWKLADLKTEMDNKQDSQPDLNLTYTIESKPDDISFNDAMIESSVSRIGVCDESSPDPQNQEIDWEAVLEHYFIENPNINNNYERIEQQYALEGDNYIYESDNIKINDSENSNMLFELLSGKKKQSNLKILKNDLDKQKIPWLELIHQLNITCDDYTKEPSIHTNLYEDQYLYENQKMYEENLVDNCCNVYDQMQPEMLLSCGPHENVDENQNLNLQVGSECSSTNSTKFFIGANLVSHSSEADIYCKGLRNYE